MRNNFCNLNARNAVKVGYYICHTKRNQIIQLGVTSEAEYRLYVMNRFYTHSLWSGNHHVDEIDSLQNCLEQLA